MDYDLYDVTKPVLGTAAELVMDGTNKTPWIDTVDWKSIAFIANIHAPARYGDIAWALEYSNDNGVTSASVAAELMLVRTPLDPTNTSQVFHAGWRGKARYVRAAFNCLGVSAAALTLVQTSSQSITGITSSSTTATATKVGHGFTTGMMVTIAGASPAAYNGTYQIVVSSSSVFTYTFAGGTSPATGTITATATAGWTNDPGATPIASITVGAAALSGNYAVSVSTEALAISSGSAASILAYQKGNTGNGVATVSNINPAGAAAILGHAIKARCTTAATDAGTFTVYLEDGTSIGTVPVGATGATLQVNAVNAFKLVIADGSADWIVGDVVEIAITDLGVNKYVLKDPDGRTIGNPLGTIAFTSTHLNFTVPDTIPVSHANATAAIAVSRGLAYGQITAMLGNPLSGPVFSTALET